MAEALTDRCIECGCPVGDHVPLRYWLKAWVKHRILRIANLLGRIDDTGADW